MCKKNSEELMKKLLVSLLMVSLLASLVFAGGEQGGGDVVITLWTQEGQAEGALQFVEAIAAEYSEMVEGVTVEVVNKDTEALREDFQTASLAGTAPQLLWTVSDHAGPFVTADLIQPVDGMFKMGDFVESVSQNGKTWGVPISSGNHLMLYYNKDLLASAPATTDELIQVGKSLTSGENYGIVWNQTEPFWLAPWLGGFGGKVFAEDGVTPTLNTKAMVDTLQFMYDLKFVHEILPAESDYAGADTLFKEGKAAMIINGDWTLGDYKAAFGDKLGIAPIPKVSATGLYPAPYTSGKYFMIARNVAGNELEAVKGFIEYALSQEVQLQMVDELSRLPALKSAGTQVSDTFLAASAGQLAYGTPMPTVLEMRCNWDSMKPELIAVLSGQKTPAQAAADMQAAAEACVEANQ
jgi:arabinogalactan oligomer/maltooligosaccharide transport system substrate-binding protein